MINPRISQVDARHYCTLFDSGYLTRGLALHQSLLRTGENFRLYIFCFDDLAFELLEQLALKNVILIPLREFETPELLSVKASRSRGEYCWTCTSHTISYTLKKFHIYEVTYLDADLYFFQKPSLLLEEFHNADASVLITEHRYSPEYDQSKTSGKYCVQFMTFKADSRGTEVLEWWKARCLEWCFNRHEDGKFGDQKYLDDWTTRFKGVHELRNIGGGVAPWNVQQYTVTPGPNVNGVPVVFYHFHQLKWLTNGRFELAPGYKLNEAIVADIYSPYIEELKLALAKVRKLVPEFNLGKVAPERGIRVELRKWKRKLQGNEFFLSE